MTTTGLLTDHYELTMIRAALEGGTAQRRAVFEVFARQLPPGRRYGVVAGTGRFLDALARFSFEPDELEFLRDRGVIDAPTAEFLAGYRFSGSIWGYAEGELYFPGSPILIVESTFAEAVALETLALSIFNHDSAIASAAARMVTAAGDRPIIEMGSRRTHEIAAVAAARAAYLAGFACTSNLRAGLDYGVPTAGTSAHAFTLVHDNERQAFGVQLEALGAATTLLVDTYDVPTAVRTAVELAGSALGAVRIDSGDVAEVAIGVRAQLDSLGATATKIVVTGDLDEHSIAALAKTPVDGYGVGTALVTGSGAPTSSLVYKLVARSASAAPAGLRHDADPAGLRHDADPAGLRHDAGHAVPQRGAGAARGRHGAGAARLRHDSAADLEPVAKRSAGKPTIGGRKWAARGLDQAGTATAEVVSLSSFDGRPGFRPLLHQLVRDGKIIGTEALQAAQDRHKRALAELPASARDIRPGAPAIPTRLESASAHQPAPSGSDS